jgi:hypothetical protein
MLKRLENFVGRFISGLVDDVNDAAIEPLGELGTCTISPSSPMVVPTLSTTVSGGVQVVTKLSTVKYLRERMLRDAEQWYLGARYQEWLRWRFPR